MPAFPYFFRPTAAATASGSLAPDFAALAATALKFAPDPGGVPAAVPYFFDFRVAMSDPLRLPATGRGAVANVGVPADGRPAALLTDEPLRVGLPRIAGRLRLRKTRPHVRGRLRQARGGLVRCQRHQPDPPPSTSLIASPESHTYMSPRPPIWWPPAPAPCGLDMNAAASRASAASAASACRFTLAICRVESGPGCALFCSPATGMFPIRSCRGPVAIPCLRSARSPRP